MAMCLLTSQCTYVEEQGKDMLTLLAILVYAAATSVLAVVCLLAHWSTSAAVQDLEATTSGKVNESSSSSTSQGEFQGHAQGCGDGQENAAAIEGCPGQTAKMGRARRFHRIVQVSRTNATTGSPPRDVSIVKFPSQAASEQQKEERIYRCLRHAANLRLERLSGGSSIAHPGNTSMERPSGTKATSGVVRSLGGDVLLDLPARDNPYLMSVPLKHFVCKRMGLDPDWCHLLCGQHELDEDTQIRSILPQPDDGLVEFVLLLEDMPEKDYRLPAFDADLFE